MKKYTALLVGLVAFVYYVLLSARTWTWVFVSSDSGDWLMCSNWFVVPQPYGSPLYISLMRLIGVLTDGNTTVVAATILLSCLPSAITVMLVYLAVEKLTQKVWLAITSSIVLLGCGIFLTQSIILEQYASAIMFCTLAFWFYLLGRKKLTALCLGLGTAIHAFVLPIALMWCVIDYLSHRNARTLITPTIIFVVSGILPYLMVPVLMYLDTPRLLAGSLSPQSLKEYLEGVSGTIIGNLSIFEVPNRLLAVGKILLMSLGLAFIPLWYGLKKPFDAKKVMLMCTIVFAVWYHFTCMDPVTWTFMCFGLPAAAILVGVGLSKLIVRHTQVVVACALILVCMNGFFLNADTLTNEKPYATTYYTELMSLPNESVVVTTAGAHSLGLFYVMSEHPEKGLVPIVYPYGCLGDFPDYTKYMRKEFGLEGDNTLKLTQDALSQNCDVYFAGARWKSWRVQECFYYLESDRQFLQPIAGLSGVPIKEIVNPND